MLEILIVKAGIASGGGIVITEDVLKAIAEGEPERYTYDEATGALYLNFRGAIQRVKNIAGLESKARGKETWLN